MTRFKLPDIGEDFSLHGHWWLPEQSDEKKAGRLACIGGRMTLEIMGVLPGIDPLKAFTKVPIVHGAAEANAITLIGCYQSGPGFKIPGTMVGHHLFDG